MFFNSNYFGFLRKVSGTSLLTDKSRAAGIGVDSADSYNLKFNKNGTVRTVLDTDNYQSSVAGVASSLAEVVASANVITAAESGKTFFLSAASEFASTLPAPALGLRYRFVVAAAPVGASYTITTNSSANIILGHAVSAADAGGSVDSEATGCDTISFVDGQAVVGDWIEVESDGTNWFAHGSCADEDAITFTTAS